MPRSRMHSEFRCDPHFSIPTICSQIVFRVASARFDVACDAVLSPLQKLAGIILPAQEAISIRMPESLATVFRTLHYATIR